MRLLYGMPGVSHENPVWTSLPLLKRLTTFISVTSMGFPPTMVLPTTPPSSPPQLLSPLWVPPPVFRAFFVGRGLKREVGFKLVVILSFEIAFRGKKLAC